MKKIINKILLAICGILAINACEPMVAYGTPWTDYEEREQAEDTDQEAENGSDENENTQSKQ